jgi:hypothetical protein
MRRSTITKEPHSQKIASILSGMLILTVLILAAPVQLKTQNLTIVVSNSELAQWFHVVDHASTWSPFSHKQYRAMFAQDAGVSSDDADVLAAYASVRKQLGYGLLERSFYAERSLDEALALLSKELDGNSVAIVRRAMLHFKDRVLPFLRSKQSVLLKHQKKIAAQRTEIEKFAALAEQFFHCGPTIQSVFLIPSVDANRGGGGANGGVLTIEVSEDQPPLDILIHETWHALGECQKPIMIEAAKKLALRPSLKAALDSLRVISWHRNGNLFWPSRIGHRWKTCGLFCFWK